ncbi:Immunoglobulin subtype,Immunoglobulin-like domain,Immunoglobulin-like fold,von Willebrand factor [Cinara cedri]|uniref:Immunoglobulin subtype,Immunoglobulin-like domain,Immunoglobulin-like fold,von Willebrand factor n=1 Tax=Cinara cedri TaxID=506608 RepID=A0A5E4M4B9_9HEMI|nr:Immunoglobulin subtype,Immunoglobulin-like domain,Immunoglobulin-like fold,von Willebrand factor [Cinara cedri]
MIMRRRNPLAVSCLLAAVMLSTTTTISNSEDVYRSLAFVFDTSGSMYNDLSQLRSQAKQIMMHVQNQKDSSIKHFVFVPFNDPNVGPVTETFNPNKIMDELNHIKTVGGYDCPEMSISAVIQALKVVKPNSYIYVFTDASAKDSHLVNEALELMQRKKSQVIVLKTGSCHDMDTSYERITSLGSGNVINVDKNDLTKVLEFIKTSMKKNKVNLLSVDVPKVQINNLNPWLLYIDESIKNVSISVSGINPSIKLLNPNKTITNIIITLNLKNIKIGKIMDPIPGIWELCVTSDSAHSIRVVGDSDSLNNFNFGFSTAQPNNITQTSHRPLRGNKNYVLIDFPNIQEFNSCMIQDLDNKQTKPLPIFPTGNILLCGPFLPDDKPFYLQINGKSKNGHCFKRITQMSIISAKPDVPYLTMRKKIPVELGAELIINCHVESLVPFTVTWTFNGHKKPPLYFNQSSGVEIAIHNVSQQHVGTYTCAAQNVLGHSETMTEVMIVVKPTIDAGNDDVTVVLYEGEDYSMTCSGNGNPSPKMEWFFISSDHIFVYKGSRLIIFDATPSDSNLYTCRATNINGVAEKKYNIIVKVNTTKSLANESLTKTQSEDVTMKCPFQNISVNWLKDGTNINSLVEKRADVKHFSIKEQSLKIYDIEIADTAVYTCMNSNNTYTFDLKVLFPPSFIKNPEETFMLKRNDTVLFDCMSDGYPTPKVVWKKKESVMPINQWTTSGVEFLENKQKLKIHSIDWVHNGTYSCYVRNDLGKLERNFELLVF